MEKERKQDKTGHKKAAETGKWSHSVIIQHRQHCNVPFDLSMSIDVSSQKQALLRINGKRVMDRQMDQQTDRQTLL